MQAHVTINAVNTLPAVEPTTYARNKFYIMGDSKVLRTLTIETDVFGVAEAFKNVRRRARRIEGATSIRYGLGTYNID